MSTLGCPAAEVGKVVAALGYLDALRHAFQVALRVLQTHDVGVVGQALDDVNGNRHVCRGQDVVQHQRTGDAVGQRPVVFVHLFLGQRVVGGQRGHDDVGTKGGVDLGLAHLLAEAVARQSGINQNATCSSLHCRFYKQLTVSL